MSSADDFVPINRASDFIPGHPHVSTVHRWRLHGVKLPDGSRAKLQTTRVGGREYVRLQDIEQFLTVLNSRDLQQESESDVTRRSREARAALEKLGV